MQSVEFEDQNVNVFETKRKMKQTPVMVLWLERMGIPEKYANYVLLGLSILSLVSAAIIFKLSLHTSSQPSVPKEVIMERMNRVHTNQ